MEPSIEEVEDEGKENIQNLLEGFFFFSNFVSFYLCIKSIGGFVVKFVVFGYAKEISAFLAGVETWFLR